MDAHAFHGQGALRLNTRESHSAPDISVLEPKETEVDRIIVSITPIFTASVRSYWKLKNEWKELWFSGEFQLFSPVSF